jgi:hypothetical protein
MFKQAATNADAIRFDVSSFTPGKINGYTQLEFETILADPSLSSKTTWWRGAQEMLWTGTEFVTK